MASRCSGSVFPRRLPEAREQRGSFDAVVCTNVLHLVPDLGRAIAAMKEVIRPGGKLVAPTFVHDETLLSRAVSRLLAVTGSPGRRRLTTASLRMSLEQAGIEVHRIETVSGVIPICFLARSVR
jgi:phosphatidylethanolamine/phosphatidyl-N-methylethanolamine N-methyltransferase